MINWLPLKRLNNMHIKPTMRRRLRFATLSMINQILLIALAIAWIVHIAIIGKYGAVYFEEGNPIVLWAEIITLVLITTFSIYIFVLQVRRFGERRRDSDMREGDRS
jgi:membrane protein YdbS with pleckstrin-like domain